MKQHTMNAVKAFPFVLLFPFLVFGVVALVIVTGTADKLKGGK